MGVEVLAGAAGLMGVGTLLAVGPTAMQYIQGEEAKKAAEASANAQRQSLAAQERAANVQAQRERIQQVRQARIAQAQIINTAGIVGLGTGTSGVSGGISGAGSQAGANIGAINVAQSFGQEASMWNARASEAQSNQFAAQTNQQMWGAVSNLQMQAFTGIGGFSIFKTPVASAK